MCSRRRQGAAGAIRRSSTKRSRLRAFRRHGIHVLGSFIFGLNSDTKETFDATVALAEQADLTFAQLVLLTPVPGTVDFEKWVTKEQARETMVDGVPLTQHWLIPEHRRPRLCTPHPSMSLEEIRVGTQRAWDHVYSWRQVWARSRVVESLKARVAFVLISKLYRQMYANTGIATDSARGALRAMGALDRLRVSPTVSWEADAEPHDAWRAACRTRTQLKGTIGEEWSS